MRILQNSEIISISGGVDVESAAKWGGEIGGILGIVAGGFGGVYMEINLLETFGVHPYFLLLVSACGFAGFAVGKGSGSLLGTMGAMGYNALAASATSK
jgi:hypothetical protein